MIRRAAGICLGVAHCHRPPRDPDRRSPTAPREATQRTRDGWRADSRNVTEARAAALCGGSVLILQQATQPRTTRNRAVAASFPLDREEQPVAHALMVAFVMIVLDEFANHVPERAFANDDQLIQTRFLDRPHEAFRVRVEIGRTGREAAGFDA